MLCRIAPFATIIFLLTLHFKNQFGGINGGILQVIIILEELWAWTGEHELILTSAHNSFKPVSENTVNNALRVMGYLIPS